MKVKDAVRVKMFRKQRSQQHTLEEVLYVEPAGKVQVHMVNPDVDVQLDAAEELGFDQGNISDTGNEDLANSGGSEGDCFAKTAVHASKKKRPTVLSRIFSGFLWKKPNVSVNGTDEMRRRSYISVPSDKLFAQREGFGRSSLPKDWLQSRMKRSLRTIADRTFEYLTLVDLAVLPPDSFEILCRKLRVGKVKAVHFQNVNLERAGMIAASLGEPDCTLEELRLSEVEDLSEEFFQGVQECLSLKLLSVNRSRINSAGLGEAIQVRQFHKVTVRLCNLLDGDLKHLFAYGRNNGCIEIDLGGNQIGPSVGISQWAPSRLRVLGLQSNNIETQGVLEICEAYENGLLSEIESLDLSGNPIDAEACVGLQSLCCSLLHLNLSYTNIGQEGCYLLSEFICTSSLLSLDLGGVAIGTEATIAVAFSLRKARTIKSLRLGGGSLLFPGSQFDSEPGQEGFLSMFEMLRENESLRNVQILDRNLPKESLALFSCLVNITCDGRLEYLLNRLIHRSDVEEGCQCEPLGNEFNFARSRLTCDGYALKKAGESVAKFDYGLFQMLTQWLADEGHVPPSYWCGRGEILHSFASGNVMSEHLFLENVI